MFANDTLLFLDSTPENMDRLSKSSTGLGQLQDQNLISTNR